MNSPSEKNIETEIEGFPFLFGRLNEVEPKLHRIIKKVFVDLVYMISSTKWKCFNVDKILI